MKHKLIGTVLIALAIASGCKNDNDNEDINIIRFNDGHFILYRGYSHKYSDALETGATPFVVNLLGEGVSYSSDAGKFTGTGSLITAYFYSENNAEVKNGLYTIDIFSQKGGDTADSCRIYYNFDFAQDTGKIYTIKAGTFDVVNLGRVMSYKIDIQTANFIRFTGEFRGTVDPL